MGFLGGLGFFRFLVCCVDDSGGCFSHLFVDDIVWS